MSVRKLQLCDELDRSSCGNVLFNGYLPPPGQKYVSFFYSEKCLKNVYGTILCLLSVPGEAP